MNTELWKDINGYEGLYQVSNFGNIKSRNKKLLKPALNKSGYYMVNLFKHNIGKSHYIHRLVAEAFISNPSNLPYVNHKDENKLNNSADNLEWCSFNYNCNYGTRNQRLAEKHNVAVAQYDTKGNLLNVFKSQSAAAEAVGGNQQNISSCCRGKQKTHRGFVFKVHTAYTDYCS